MLNMTLLYAINFLVGIFLVIFTVAFRSYLPALVSRETLVEGNSALQFSQSATQIMGPSIAGVLVQLVTAPLAILGDSLSFFIATVFIWFTHGNEQARHQQNTRRSIQAEIGEGLQVVFKDAILRAIALSNGTANIFWGAQLSILLLYMTTQMGNNAIYVSAIYTCGNIGFLIGTFLARRIARQWGIGHILLLMPIISTIGALLIPLATGSLNLIMIMLAIAQFLTVCPLIIYHIHEISLRQALVTDNLQGRVNATMQVISWSTTSLGALLGGWLGTTIGLRSTLFLIVPGLLISNIWFFIFTITFAKRAPSSKRASNASRSIVKRPDKRR